MDEEKAISILSQMGINKLRSYFRRAKESDIDGVLQTMCKRFEYDREKLATEIKNTIEQMLEDDRGLQEPQVQEIVSQNFEERKRKQIVKNALAREGHVTLKTLNIVCRQNLGMNERELSKLNEEIEIMQNEKENIELKLKKPSITPKEKEKLQKKLSNLENEIKPLMDSRERCLTNIGILKERERKTKIKEEELVINMINFEEYFKGITPEEFERIREENRYTNISIEEAERQGLAKFKDRTPIGSAGSEQQQDAGKPDSKGQTPEDDSKKKEVANNGEPDRSEETKKADAISEEADLEEAGAMSFGGVPLNYANDDAEVPQGKQVIPIAVEQVFPVPEEQVVDEQVGENNLPEQELVQDGSGINIPEEYLPKEPQKYITSNNGKVLDAIMREVTDTGLFTEEQIFGIMKTVHDQCGTRADDRVILKIILEEKAKSDKLNKTRMAIAEKTRDYMDLVNGNIEPDETKLRVEYDLTGAKEALPKEVWEELKELAYQSRHFAQIKGLPKSVEREWERRDRLGQTKNMIGIYIPELVYAENELDTSDKPKESQSHEDFAQSLVVPDNLEDTQTKESQRENEQKNDAQALEGLLQNSINPDGTYKSDEPER